MNFIQRTENITVCCLFLRKYSHIKCMGILNKIKLNFKRDNSFLLKPLMLLSVISAVSYGLKMLGVSAADKLLLVSIIVVITATLIRHIKNIYKRISVALILLIFFILYLNVYDDLIIFLATKCENSGVNFGVINSLFTTFGLTDFQDLIYYTSYGGAKYINGNIATGAVDIFLLNRSCREASMYLCGKYLSLFASLGIAFSLNKHRKAVFFITLFAFLTGNLTVYLLMLLFVFTPYYFLFLLFNFVCYFIANVAEIKSGFSVDGSILELIVYRENITYILILGIFICAVSYYFSRLVKERRKW